MKSHKEKISEIITVERDNNIINHIVTNFLYRGETIAEKNISEYIIWTTNYWIGTFYPIFRIKFNEKNEIKSIKSELSIYGKFWAIILISLVSVFLYFKLLIPLIEDFKFLDFTFLIEVAFYALLISSLYWVFRKIYLNETKYLLNELKIIVGLETNENIDKIEERKNEWTFKMTLFRIFAYPFSIFILFFSIFYMLPNGDLKGIIGIIFAGMYLFSDIKILVYKRTKANKS